MPSFEDLFDAIAVPVVGLDRTLNVVAANTEARRIFSASEDNGLEKIIEAKSSFKKSLTKTLETGASGRATVSLKTGFGRDFFATIRAVSPNTDGIALMITFEDRSPLKDAKNMRSDFVANVSHEIRSPLTAIAGFVETLQGAARDDPDAQNLFLGLMEKEVSRMTNLVRDLLSLSQVEVKERRAPKKIAEPDKVIQQAHESASVFATRNGKSLLVQMADDLPDIPGNHDDLVRALINLLENAVTYSRDGGVIRLNAETAPDDNPLGRPAISISISDQGDGIPAEEIPRLTERFYRVDKSRSRNAGGTGLGLAIVKHILLRHRGELKISSTLGEGSEFRIFLPISKSR